MSVHVCCNSDDQIILVVKQTITSIFYVKNTYT